MSTHEEHATLANFSFIFGGVLVYCVCCYDDGLYTTKLYFLVKYKTMKVLKFSGASLYENIFLRH